MVQYLKETSKVSLFLQLYAGINTTPCKNKSGDFYRKKETLNLPIYDVIAKKISTVLHSVKVNYEIDLH